MHVRIACAWVPQNGSGGALKHKEPSWDILSHSGSCHLQMSTLQGQEGRLNKGRKTPKQPISRKTLKIKNLGIMSLVFGKPQTKAECVYVASFLPGSFLWVLSKTVQASCPVPASWLKMGNTRSCYISVNHAGEWSHLSSPLGAVASRHVWHRPPSIPAT